MMIPDAALCPYCGRCGSYIVRNSQTATAVTGEFSPGNHAMARWGEEKQPQIPPLRPPGRTAVGMTALANFQGMSFDCGRCGDLDSEFHRGDGELLAGFGIVACGGLPG